MIPAAGPATAYLTEEVAAGLSKSSWICSRVIGQKRGWYPHITGKGVRNLAAGVSIGTKRFARKQQAKKISNGTKFFSANPRGPFGRVEKRDSHPFPGHRALVFISFRRG